MLEGPRRWFRQNRARFAIGLGAIGAVYLAGQYAWGKWLEAQQRISEERIAKEKSVRPLLSQIKPLITSSLRRRFEQNQEDCTYTVLALLPTIRDEVMGAYPVEDLSGELQRQKAERLARSIGGVSEVATTDIPSAAQSTVGDGTSQTDSFVHASQLADSTIAPGLRGKKSKVQLWHDMKVQSITRALTLIYTLSLLTLLTRIQLNLLGRRTYLSSVVSMASPPSGRHEAGISLENNDDDNFDNVYGSDFDTNRNYLTFSWWLLHKGCKDIAAKVEQAVKEVFGAINPREDVNLERLSALILEVRKKVEGATEIERTEHKWLPYLLPPKEQEQAVLDRQGSPPAAQSPRPDAGVEEVVLEQTQPSSISASLRRLIDETSDLIDSPTFTHVLTQLLNSCFTILVDTHVASEAFKIPPIKPDLPLDSQSRITEIMDRKVKLAQTLAVFCRQAHAISAGSADVEELSSIQGGNVNEYLSTIDRVPDLEAFAAVIYSSNFEYEVIDQTPSRQQLQPPAAVTEDAPVDLTYSQLGESAASFEHVWNKAVPQRSVTEEA